MKHKLLLIAAFLLISVASAHAQTPDFCIFTPFGNTDQTLVYLEYGPWFGYTAWVCPAPGTFAKFPSSKKLRWQSTCFQGGIIIDEVGIEDNDTLIAVNAYIFDPNTGSSLGRYRSITIVQDVAGQWLPQWVPVDLYGPVPCDPLAHTTGDQSFVITAQ